MHWAPGYQIKPVILQRHFIQEMTRHSVAIRVPPYQTSMQLHSETDFHTTRVASCGLWATKRTCKLQHRRREVRRGGAQPPHRLVPVADGIGTCSDAQRTSRAGEQRSRRAFAAPVFFTGSDTGPSGGRQHAEGEASAPRTAGTRRCPARQRPEGMGWTVNEIPSTRSPYQLSDRDRTVYISTEIT
jgi:hypothetical protein